MSKNKSMEASPSTSASLINLLSEKHELQKQIIELDQEIRCAQRKEGK
jgi:hypothetical protein